MALFGLSAGASRKTGAAWRPGAPRATRVPRLELLEDRVVPSVSYTYTTFEPPYSGFGNALTTPEGINDLGQIVGNYQGTSSQFVPLQEGFVLSGGQYTFLNDPNAAPNFGLGGTFAYGINNFGDVVGNYYDSNIVGHGFLYSHGTYITLDDPNAGTAGLMQEDVPGQGTYPSAINDFRQIVGSYIDANNNYHGFVYSHGTFTTLDDPAAGGFLGTAPLGINDRGQIVGLYSDANDELHGFLYSNGQFSQIDDPGFTNTPFSFSGTALAAINNFGQIVGADTGINGAQQSFLYSGGQFTPFNDYNSDSGTAPIFNLYGINDFGAMVGGTVGTGANLNVGLLITPTFSCSGSGSSNAVARPVTQPFNGASLVAALTARDPGLPAGPFASTATVGGTRSDNVFGTSATATNTTAVSGAGQTSADATTNALVDHALSAGSLDSMAFALDGFALVAGHKSDAVLA